MSFTISEAEAYFYLPSLFSYVAEKNKRSKQQDIPDYRVHLILFDVIL